MQRHVEANGNGLMLGALLGGLAGGPGGLFLGGLTGAALTNGKLPVEQAIARVALKAGLDTRAVHWLTQRELEVALSRGGGPLHIVRVIAANEAKTQEAVDDAIFDDFCAKLKGLQS